MKYYEIEMLYLENISKEDLLYCITSCIDVKEYFIILHDKDVWCDNVYNENGEIKYLKGDFKKPHFHCYIGFNDYGRKTYSIFCDYFKTLSNSFKPIKNIDSALKYGIHYGYSDKYQYNRNDYITNNFDRIDKVLSTCTCDIEDLLYRLYDNIINLKVYDNETLVTFFKDNKQLSYLISHYNYLLKFLENNLNDVVDFVPTDNRLGNYERRNN